jgi:hypothetical protein
MHYDRPGVGAFIQSAFDTVPALLTALEESEARLAKLEAFFRGLANDASGEEEFGYKEVYAKAGAFIAWREAAQAMIDLEKRK